jgi:predicted nucleotidyltransferase
MVRSRRAAIDEMVRRIAAAIDPDRIIIFGSNARDQTHADSDVDLLIIAPSDEPRWKRTVPLYRLLAGIGVPKDLLWWTPDEIGQWEHVPTHFVATALREGEVLYEPAA